MTATPYKAMKFEKNDIIVRDELDQLDNNYQWIHDNTPRGRFYRQSGEARDERTVLLCGRVRIKKNKKADVATARVRFGKAFAPNCHPHVTTGVVSDFQRKIFCVVNGPQGINYPNSDGFEVKVKIHAVKEKRDKIEKMFWVHWHAFGFRRDDVNEF